LEELAPQVLAGTGHLFNLRPGKIFNYFSHKGNLGHKVFVGPNPPFGAVISYYLKGEEKDVKVLIKNSSGETIKEIEGKKAAGINRVTWDLKYSPPDMGDLGRMSRYFRSGGPFVLPGEYQVVLQVADKEMVKSVEVFGDPRVTITFEDRKSQHDALYAIYELLPLIGTVSRATDKIRKEIAALKSDLKEVPDISETVTDAVNEVSDKSSRIRKQLFGDPDTGFSGMRESLRGKFLMLYRSIGEYTGAPTGSQIQQIEKNSEELKALVLELNGIIETDIPKLNKLLNENDVPRLFVGEPIKY
jgi:hypothetical protein